MAMGACRLLNRARQYTYSKEMGCLNKIRLKNFLEKEWSEVTLEAEKFAREQGSPFCFPILEDHVSSNNALLNGDGKKLEQRLRECKDIKFSTDFYSILEDKRLEEFQSSMTPKEIWNCVMHYMEWHSQDYPTLLEPYESLFDKLPYSCLVRGLQLHISRIPYKYTKESLPEVLKKDMLRKLKKDYKLLIEKINYMQFLNIPQATMVREINTLVRHYAANPGCSHISLDHDASSTRCEYEVGSYQVPYVGLSTF